MSTEKVLTREQCRAGRALLNWSQETLAQAAELSQAVVAKFESGRTTPGIHSLRAMRRVLEDAGVEFIPENGGGVGARLRWPAGQKPSEQK